jgi:hypothetical protein
VRGVVFGLLEAHNGIGIHWRELSVLKRVLLVMFVVVLFSLALGCTSADEAESTTDVAVDTGAPNAAGGTVDPAVLLTPADVESVSGLSGLEVVPYDPAIGAGGDVNIATADGQLVAMLVVEGPETWDAWLTDGYTVSESVTPPVGDESFIGPNPDTSPTVYIFGFRRGDVAVVIDTYFDANGETILSVEQLRQLAETVNGRL